MHRMNRGLMRMIQIRNRERGYLLSDEDLIIATRRAMQYSRGKLPGVPLSDIYAVLSRKSGVENLDKQRMSARLAKLLQVVHRTKTTKRYAPYAHDTRGIGNNCAPFEDVF